MISPVIDMIGRRSGRLLVVSRAGSGQKGLALWLCRCDCGAEMVAVGSHLRSGRTDSCGCLKRERLSVSNTKHGFSKHPLYRVRVGMIARCHNPKNTHFYCYGGRGITVCREWRDDRESFFLWALANGWEPGLDIDRRDNDGNYEPGNCRFVTPAVNARNRSDPSRWRRLKPLGSHNLSKTECPQGHPLDGVQVRKDRVLRFCRVCRKEQWIRARRKRGAKPRVFRRDRP